MKVYEAVNVPSGWKQSVECFAFLVWLLFLTFRISAVAWISFPSLILIILILYFFSPKYWFIKYFWKDLCILNKTESAQAFLIKKQI